ncbi:hypothetical protein SAMN05443572_103465 [Myxococcus fulvus]|uniref:Lipoprotein n=1 Tax=Myxococcus fulvus TaxID=33 RepID=A0A511TG15_MYXFU|nr:hypothetical protein [Myxococcus fulvus]GEN12603.1 hypothetical protein MFU01_76400 [Myxococcus fulvus]SET84386.1 hypothetical protein SAMN05443572_103465 [Myxococcus fulvus]
MKRLSWVFMLVVLAMSSVACGGALDEGGDLTPPPEVSEPSANAGGEDGQVSSMAVYGCCALCNNRDRYHLVEGVVSSCTDRARDYCAVGTRGGLWDAAWTYCDP